MTELDGIIDDIKEYLTFRHECGDRFLSLPPDCIPRLPAQAQQGARRPVVAGAARPQATAPAAQPTQPRQPDEERPSVTIQATPATEPTETLEAIASEIKACQGCGLCGTRTNVVPGQGNANGPDVMFIGEAPGQDEDLQGLAFVGRAGQLLTKMIEAMGYTRDEVFIANVCKCRPPGNRNPDPAESNACLPFLIRQIKVVKPKCIVALGRIAMQALYDSQVSLSSVRGKWTVFQGVPLLPTYHPAYLLRYPVAKRDAWADLKKVMAKFGKLGGRA